MEGIPPISASDIDRIVKFIFNSVKGAGAEGVVVGLSGGLDSAVVSRLSVMALGKGRVLNVFMPSSGTLGDDCKIASDFSKSIGAEFVEIQVGPVVESFAKSIGSKSETCLDLGNIAARSRMTILYNLAKKKNRLVIGTSNRSELMMGYFTKHGDAGCDMMPLAGLYKTQVRLVAKQISIPEAIISRPPSAGFWEGQTDEGEMKITYEELDSILSGHDRKMKPSEISKSTGISESEVKRILDTVSVTEHKRHFPPSPEF